MQNLVYLFVKMPGRVPVFGVNSEGNNEPQDLCPLCKRKSPQNMQDARQALGHVMSTETKTLLVASFIGGFLEDDKMAAIVSDHVMMFRSYTQFSKGKTNSLSVQVIQNS
jgi:hypothetical protein